MSVAEPVEPVDDEARKALIEAEADVIEIPDEYEPPISGAPHKDVCAKCLRPVCLVGESEILLKAKYPKGYCHWDGRIDEPANPAHHVAELFIEPPVRWGFLDVRGKSNLEVTSNAGRSGDGT